MVIFVFLRNVWATVIPSLALPFSIIGTFAVMYLLGYSLDNLSMMALILSVGFVVDDAIVMLENIYRHVEMGEDPLDGVARRLARDRLHDRVDDAVARRGVHPGAVHGRRARPAVPRVLGHDLRRDPDLRRRVGHADADAVQPLPQEAARARRGSRSSAQVDRARLRAACCDGYDRTLQVVLRHRAATMVGVRRRAGRSTGVLFVARAEGLHPRPGHRSDRGHDRSGAGHVVRQAGRVPGRGRRHHPAAIRTSKALVSTIGGSAAHDARRPEPRPDRRPPEAARRAQGARRTTSSRSCGRSSPRSPACRCTCRTRRRSASAARSARACISSRCSRRTAKQLYAAARKLREGARRRPGHRGPDERPRRSRARRSTSRSIATRRRRSASRRTQIENAFYDAYGPRWVSTIYAPVNEYKVLLELAPQFQADPAALSLLYFKATPGTTRRRVGCPARHAVRRRARNARRSSGRRR